MDLLPIAFLVLLILLGGAIAYGADWLGRHIGKKRKTLFRLRPRHAGALITTAAGMTTTLVVILLIALLSQGVRQWILEGNQAIAQRNAAIRERDQAVRERDERIAQLDRLNREVAEQQQENQRLNAEERRLRGDLTQLRADVARSQQEARVLRAQAVRLRTELVELRNRFASTQRNLQKLTTDYGILQRNYQNQQLSLAQLNRNMEFIADRETALDLQLRAKEREAEALERRIADFRRDFDELTKQFNAQQENFARETARARTELDTARRELEEANRARDEAQASAAALRRAQENLARGLQTNLEVTRLLPLVFSVNEEIARMEVPIGLTEAEARRYVRGLLAQARTIAFARGARGPQDSTDAAGLWNLPFELRTLTAAEQEDTVVNAITARDEQSVIIAYSFWNSFSAEFVPVRLEAFSNPMVFREGQIVAEIRVNGNLSEEEVIQSIQRLLTENVNRQARAMRMIPMSGREEQFGEVSREAVLDAVRVIREARRTVRLVAVAARDTRAAGPLQLQLRVR